MIVVVSTAANSDRVLAAVDAAVDEIVDFTRELIRIPTVNPPGDAYEDCARLIGERLAQCGFAIDFLVPETHPDHSRAYPRVNVVATWRGASDRPLVHLNGHMDVVPPGAGWTVPPFEGVVRDGRIYGRGACDMKAGIAAAVFAAEAIRRADVALKGTIEISATVDEESGGFAGVGWLCEQGRISSTRTDAVIIPEPLNVDRICIGHRGVYWFEVITHGRVAHGSMPFLGTSAIDAMTAILERFRTDYLKAISKRRTRMPVVPAEAGRPTLNINAVAGGQPTDSIQTPCVADRCRAVFDRRFLAEEPFDEMRNEIHRFLAAIRGAGHYEVNDLMVVHPVCTPAGAPVIGALHRAVAQVLGRPATLIASPGTYDHKHVDRIGGVKNCVAYGPGILDLAHQPDEWCAIDDLINATKVLALALIELAGV